MSVEILRARLIKGAWAVFVMGAVYLSIKYLLGLVLPFLLAAGVAELTHRPVDTLAARTRLPRRLVSFLVVTVTLLALAGLAWGGIYGLYAAAQAALEKLPGLLGTLQEGLHTIKDATGSLSARLPAALAQALEEAPAALVGTLTKAATDFLAGRAGRLPALALTATVTVIASYLISADYHKLGVFLRQVIRPAIYDKLCVTRRVVRAKLKPLARGYGILLLLTFGELLAGFLLLGVPRPAGAAALVALVDLLPILGTGTVLIPWASVALLQGQTGLGAGLFALYGLVSLVRSAVEPRVIGAQIELSPLIVLICMFIGWRLFGFQGLLLAPFAASIGKELVKQDVL